MTNELNSLLTCETKNDQVMVIKHEIQDCLATLDYWKSCKNQTVKVIQHIECERIHLESLVRLLLEKESNND